MWQMLPNENVMVIRCTLHTLLMRCQLPAPLIVSWACSLKGASGPKEECFLICSIMIFNVWVHRSQSTQKRIQAVALRSVKPKPDMVVHAYNLST